MKLTKHINKRMSQRGITRDVIELVAQFGVEVESDQIILSRKVIDEIRKNASRFLKELDGIQETGGDVSYQNNQLTVCLR